MRYTDPVPTKDELIEALIRAADEPSELVGSSVRLPRNVRDAIRMARAMGYGDSLTSITTQAIRTELRYVAQDLAIELHFAEHPEARPSLAERVRALALILDHPLADQPDRIDQLVSAACASIPEIELEAEDVVRLADLLESDTDEPMTEHRKAG